jgi:5-methylcytosine-specific restriction endonuclease McrA
VRKLAPKQPRIELAPEVYEQLRLSVLQRDNWRCQNCGSFQNLEVHHKIPRSQSGDDSELNLITLCHSCHSNEHASALS